MHFTTTCNACGQRYAAPPIGEALGLHCPHCEAQVVHPAALRPAVLPSWPLDKLHTVGWGFMVVGFALAVLAPAVLVAVPDGGRVTVGGILLLPLWWGGCVMVLSLGLLMRSVAENARQRNDLFTGQRPWVALGILFATTCGLLVAVASMVVR